MEVKRLVDPRLIVRGTQIIDVVAPEGSKVWKLVRADFYPVGNGSRESGGRHNCYIEAEDEDGISLANIPFIFGWSTGQATIITNGRKGFDAGNQPFSPGENAFSVTKSSGDTVNGIGMGQMTPSGFNPGEHTSTLLRYQRFTESASSGGDGPIPPNPDPEKHLISTIYLYSDGSYEQHNG